MSGLEHETKVVVEPASAAMEKAADDFFKLLYLDHEFEKAILTHTAPSFIEHNPDLPNSPQDQIKWFAERAAANPDKIAPEIEWNTRHVHRFIVKNYLIVHYWMSIGKADRGRMFADFWKFDGNKIVEHWDVVQPVPEKTMSGNPMW